MEREDFGNPEAKYGREPSVGQEGLAALEPADPRVGLRIAVPVRSLSGKLGDLLYAALHK